VLNSLYYIPALLSIWMRPDPADERAVLADATPENAGLTGFYPRRPRSFTASILSWGSFITPSPTSSRPESG
jgi:hypothetical protein